ncbi:unnamed protein product, partial [Phyllotreta striolata]
HYLPLFRYIFLVQHTKLRLEFFPSKFGKNSTKFTMPYDCSAKFCQVCCKKPYCYGIYKYPSVFYKTCFPPAHIIPRCDTDWMINHKYEKCEEYKVVDKVSIFHVVLNAYLTANENFIRYTVNVFIYIQLFPISFQ